MIFDKILKFTKGWFIGDFEPSILKTNLFEVGLLTRYKGQDDPPHYHAIATEYNVVVSGSMTINGNFLEKGDVFIIEKNETTKSIFHEDTTLLVVKVPSVPSDKYEVFDENI